MDKNVLLSKQIFRIPSSSSPSQKKKFKDRLPALLAQFISQASKRSKTEEAVVKHNFVPFAPSSFVYISLHQSLCFSSLCYQNRP